MFSAGNYLALDPDVQVTALQFNNLNSQVGRVLKARAAEKLIELQAQVLMGQSSRKENSQPNKLNQQGRQPPSGNDQGRYNCTSAGNRDIDSPEIFSYQREQEGRAEAHVQERWFDPSEDDSYDDLPENA